MIKYICDFCGSERSGMNDIFAYNFDTTNDKEIEAFGIDHEKFVSCKNHICFNCFKKFSDWLNAVKGKTEG